MSTVAAPDPTRPTDPTRSRSDTSPVTAREASGARLVSLDILRGAVMVLMALDHVRVYSGLPAGGPTPGIFFTRWVTNFCAPIFVFLAGTGSYLYGSKLQARLGDHEGRRALARWLAVRGAWLVLLELTVLRFAWTFNMDYAHYVLAGVIWAIGWCMILMAALVWLPLPAIAANGLVIIAGHDLLDPHLPALTQSLSGSSLAWLWQLLYFGGPIAIGSSRLMVLYSIIPWIGAMAAGYAFGPVMRMDPARRARWCYAMGGGAIAAFLLLRATNLYGDPRPWTNPSPTPALLRFLNTNKYPASLLFLLMTLGPAIALIPLLEQARGRVAHVLETFGRVPLFFYVLHIPLIHLAAIVVSLLRTGSVTPWLFANHPMLPPDPPAGYTWSLPLLYLVTTVVVAMLYVPCRWYAALKARRREAWLQLL